MRRTSPPPLELVEIERLWQAVATLWAAVRPFGLPSPTDERLADITQDLRPPQDEQE